MVQNVNGAFPLNLAGEGDRVRIASLKGGRNFRARLCGMALNAGSEIEIIQSSFGGRMLVAFEGTRLFLGGGMAQKIDVTVIRE
ncbi:MAG: FeoA domain-containing protein [Deltaproteobacteria bacterium]|nr:FeoA domain-containing protein [Deltaproteobacteria bacterium]